jgi:dTDP-D-glucose 4,6-dehydratase
VNIGGAVVGRLLAESEALVFNLDKCGDVSDLTSIEALPEATERHTLLRVDLSDAEATTDAVRQADPDLVTHLAAESHVDYSIEGPGAYGSTSSPDFVYIESKKDRTAVVRCDGGSSRGWSFGLQRMGSAS